MAITYENPGSGNRHRWTFSADPPENGTGQPARWQGGRGNVFFSKNGTLGGGTIQLEWSGDEGATFGNLGLPTTETTIAAQSISVAPGLIRPVLTAATLPDFVLVVA